MLGEHSKVEDEGTDSLLRLAGTRVRHDSRFRREYGWREGGIDGAHQQAVESTTRKVVGHPLQVQLQLLGPDLRTAMTTAYALVGAPLRESPRSSMYLCEQIRTKLRPPMLRTFGLRDRAKSTYPNPLFNKCPELSDCWRHNGAGELTAFLEELEQT